MLRYKSHTESTELLICFVCAESLQSCPTLWHHGLYRLLCLWDSPEKIWSGLPFPPSGDLPDPGIEPASLMSPASVGRFFTTSTTCEALICFNLPKNSHLCHGFKWQWCIVASKIIVLPLGPFQNKAVISLIFSFSCWTLGLFSNLNVLFRCCNWTWCSLQL